MGTICGLIDPAISKFNLKMLFSINRYAEMHSSGLEVHKLVGENFRLYFNLPIHKPPTPPPEVIEDELEEELMLPPVLPEEPLLEVEQEDEGFGEAEAYPEEEQAMHYIPDDRGPTGKH